MFPQRRAIIKPIERKKVLRRSQSTRRDYIVLSRLKVYSYKTVIRRVCV